MQEAAEREKKLCLALRKNVNDERGVILELHGEENTDEATAFTNSLRHMLLRACERHNWKWMVLQEDQAANYGLRSLSLKVTGRDVYRYLKYEEGVHRAAWVPMFHSERKPVSVTASVAVMLLINADELILREEDIVEDTYFTMRGPGSHLRGRYPNALRLCYKPSHVVATIEATDNKYTLAQLRTKAEMLLRARVKHVPPQCADTRPIRIYDWPKQRVKDRRVPVVTELPDVLNGDLQPLWDALIAADEVEALKTSTEE